MVRKRAKAVNSVRTVQSMSQPRIVAVRKQEMMTARAIKSKAAQDEDLSPVNNNILVRNKHDPRPHRVALG